MSPELVAWATQIVKQNGGTYEVLSAEMLKAGYSRADIDGVYAVLVSQGIAPARGQAGAATAPVAPGTPVVPTATVPATPATAPATAGAAAAPGAAPAAPMPAYPDATVIAETNNAPEHHYGVILFILFLLLAIGGPVGAYYMAAQNPQGALAGWINSTAVSLYLDPPFSASGAAPVTPTKPITPAPVATSTMPLATTSAMTASTTNILGFGTSTATTTAKLPATTTAATTTKKK